MTVMQKLLAGAAFSAAVLTMTANVQAAPAEQSNAAATDQSTPPASLTQQSKEAWEKTKEAGKANAKKLGAAAREKYEHGKKAVGDAAHKAKEESKAAYDKMAGKGEAAQGNIAGKTEELKAKAHEKAAELKAKVDKAAAGSKETGAEAKSAVKEHVAKFKEAAKTKAHEAAKKVMDETAPIYLNRESLRFAPRAFSFCGGGMLTALRRTERFPRHGPCSHVHCDSSSRGKITAVPQTNEAPENLL